MAKPRSKFVCQSCGYESPRWLGRCPRCESWDGFVEEKPRSEATDARRSAPRAEVVGLRTVEEDGFARFSSGEPLLDRVLGGGVVTGSAVLLAGEPGIGKSTLMLQTAEALAASGRLVLYVSAEESPRQLRLRAERLGCGHEGLLVAGETAVESVLAAADEEGPDVIVVDSIQAVRSLDLDGMPGSVSQVRACAERLVDHAKRSDRSLFLVGHVTKTGGIAGPKSLEHLVDTVLGFEGDGGAEHRLLRAAKNRFGPTGEVVLFEMHDTGLTAVEDPSSVLLAERRPGVAGSAVTASIQGSRPLLVEVQALVHGSGLPSPRRTSVGLDGSRTALLVAVLERFAGLSLGDRDLFVNVAGGLTLREPAVDLAVAAALISAASGEPLGDEVALFGEVGLLGEVRPVSRAESRLREIAALGFRRVFCPAVGESRGPEDLEVVVVSHVSDLAERIG